ncbi:BQ2448_5345 [Microbotryum intermedium]|uniref:BQ2448_5345 protein n=1 Tax=Microbotryum intermedium TaxID=269621 RepID=A0A238F793_9BASI|nr:BQ2448_5345 [Microbotryum intermedium]
MASLRTAFGALLGPRSNLVVVATTRAFTSSASVRSSETSTSSSSTEAAAAAPEAKSTPTEPYRSQVLNQATQRLNSQASRKPSNSNLGSPSTRAPSFPSNLHPRTRAPPGDAFDWNRAWNSTPMPHSRPDAEQTPEEIWASTNPIGFTLPVSVTTARSIAVRNRDVARAYRNLNRILFENNVRKELRRQERFESPSDKRVRLDSERHRRRFKVEVGKQVGKALRLRQRM